MAKEILEAITRLQSQVVDGFKRVDDRFDRLERHVETFRSETLSHFEAIYKRFDHLRAAFQALEEGNCPSSLTGAKDLAPCPLPTT